MCVCGAFSAVTKNAALSRPVWYHLALSLCLLFCLSLLLVGRIIFISISRLLQFHAYAITLDTPKFVSNSVRSYVFFFSPSSSLLLLLIHSIITQKSWMPRKKKQRCYFPRDFILVWRLVRRLSILFSWNPKKAPTTTMKSTWKKNTYRYEFISLNCKWKTAR